MRNDFRQFLIYDFEVAARKAGASVPTMHELAAVLNRQMAAGRTYAISGGTGTLLLGGLQLDTVNDALVLLVRLSDKNAPNSVYSDPASGFFNEHQKVGNQGADFGCHVLISLSPERGLPNTYTCAIERIVGLPPALVQRLISKFLNFEYHDDPAFFSYPSPGGGITRAGTPRMDRCCPHVEMRGRPSPTLVDDINNGRLSGVSLIKTETATPLAGAPFLVKKKSELKLDINYGSLPANIWNGLTAAIGQHAGTYQSAKIAYRLPTSDRTVTVEIDTATATPLADIYVQTFDVSRIFPFLAQSARSIVPHLRDLAVAQLLAHRTI